MKPFDRFMFDHVGIVTEAKKPDETWVESSRCWVTNPRKHPFNIEFLRYEHDSPVTGILRSEPHVAYRVDDIQSAVEGCTILLGPFEVGNGFAIVVFVESDGVIVEFIQYADPRETGWF